MRFKRFFGAWFQACTEEGKALHLTGFTNAARHCAHAVAGSKGLVHKSIRLGKETLMVVREKIPCAAADRY